MNLENQIEKIYSKKDLILNKDDCLVVKEVIRQIDQGKLRVSCFIEDRK